MDTSQNLVSPKPEPDLPLIFPHQEAVYHRLVGIGQAYLGAQNFSFCRPRGHTLLVGPSGTGKTHLARQVARELDVPLLCLSVSGWVLLECSKRGAGATWPSIFRFLEQHHCGDGAMIFIDEIDKVTLETEWETFLRLEIFQILDASVPNDLRLNRGDDDSDRIDPKLVLEVQEFLARRTFIVAAGAFQNLWEERSRPTMGFKIAPTESIQTELSDLARILPRELTNRFRSSVLALPRLSESDYHSILRITSQKVPPFLRETFLRLGESRVPTALGNQQGVRFLEEVLLDTLVVERAALRTNSTSQLALPLTENIQKLAEDLAASEP
jgi:hypothetical protein